MRLTLVVTAHPRTIALAAGWAARTARWVGPRRLLGCRIRPVSCVMHQFMDAADVTCAWELIGCRPVSGSKPLGPSRESTGPGPALAQRISSAIRPSGFPCSP